MIRLLESENNSLQSLSEYTTSIGYVTFKIDKLIKGSVVIFNILINTPKQYLDNQFFCYDFNIFDLFKIGSDSVMKDIIKSLIKQYNFLLINSEEKFNDLVLEVSDCLLDFYKQNEKWIVENSQNKITEDEKKYTIAEIKKAFGDKYSSRSDEKFDNYLTSEWKNFLSYLENNQS